MAIEVYEVVISGTLAGQFVQNVIHVATDDGNYGNPFEGAIEVANGLNAVSGFVYEWCNALPVQYSITSLRVRRVLPTGGPTYIVLANSLLEKDGQRSGNISSAQVNPVLVWITTPRPNRPGRTFLPGVSETDIDAMTYTSGLIGAFNALIGVMTSSITVGTGTGDFVIYRRNLNTADDITYGRISPLVGTQRRRLKPV